MPIYEYACQACGRVSEVMQKLSDAAPHECPSCHQGPLKKIMSKTAFVLKGNGWYVTDFRDSGKKPAAAASADGEAGKSDAAGKSETKPEGSDAPAKADAPATSDTTKPLAPVAPPPTATPASSKT